MQIFDEEGMFKLPQVDSGMFKLPEKISVTIHHTICLLTYAFLPVTAIAISAQAAGMFRLLQIRLAINPN